MIADSFHSTLHGYVDDVLSGRIISSKAVRGAAERFQRDCARQSTQDFPYHFDETLAAKACRFYPSIIRHSIGRYAGMPFELEPWQVFCVANIFGWLRDCDQTRRFRKTYRSMARKNGKSTWIAAESIYMAGFDRNPIRNCVEPVSQVVLSASKREQVDKIVFAEAKRMRLKSPALEKRSDFIRKEIRFPANDGEIVTTGSDKPYDGLNPHNVNMDELHAWREHHREFYDTMVTGSGFRDQPLISIITTAGDDRSLLWREVYEYAKAVALGVIQDDLYFSYIAELDEDDDPFDESVWIKANPNLGVSVRLDYLRGEATEAKTSAVKTNRFTRYHGNRLVTSTEKAFDLEAWDKCEGVVDEWEHADAVGSGVDLGARDDLAAAAQVARFVIGEREGRPIYRFEVKVQAFISEETERDLTKEPFCQWIYDGLIQKSRFPIADLRDLTIENARLNSVSAVAYDPYNAQSFAEEMQREGLAPLRMAQNHAMFNEPIRDFLQAVKDQRVIHDGNPLLRWAANNAVLYRDRRDLWMFDKKSSAEKIDPIVAVVMAFRVCCLAPSRASGNCFFV